MDLHPLATQYLAAGLCVLPANPSRKMPRLAAWRDFPKRLPTADEPRQGSPFDGLCIVCGPTSGNLEMIDFDGQGELYRAWDDAVRQVAPQLMGRLSEERSDPADTPTLGGGNHA